MKKRTKNPYSPESDNYFAWQRGYLREAFEDLASYQEGLSAIEEDEKEIPKGSYCYVAQGWETTTDGKMVLKTKVCPYFYKTKNGCTGCSYLEIEEEYSGEEILLSDQVKECGVKDS